MPSSWNGIKNKHGVSLLSLSAVALLLLMLISLGRAANAADFLFFHVGVLGLLLCPLTAAYYLLRPELAKPPSLHGVAFALLLLILLTHLLYLFGSSLVEDLLGVAHRRFRHPTWQGLGLALAASVYLPMIIRELRSSLRAGDYVSLLPCGAFLLCAIMLFLPSGFDSIGQWESWVYRAYLEGQPSWNVEYELGTRFWVMTPHLLATVIAPESFAGFHLTQLLIIWGGTTFLYGILRRIGFAPLYAFLTALLCMVYPVNSALMSLRSLPNQFSVMALLGAFFLAMECGNRPSRLRLLGIWLALVFNVVSNETAYALILVAPLFWILKKPRVKWKNVSMSAIWYLLPACHIAHLLTLSALNLRYYNSYVFEGAADLTGVDAASISEIIPRLADVYRRSFVDGWTEAFAALASQDFLLMSLAMAAIVGAAAWLLLRRRPVTDQLSEGKARATLAIATLMFVPSVGVLIWLPQYAGDSWRMYFYVPLAASVAAFCVIRLLTAPIASERYRNAAIVIICLTLIVPAVSRLLQQREAIVQSANSKARVFYDILRLLPSVESDSHILLTTDMTGPQLADSDLYELGYSKDLDNSILYILYGNRDPIRSVFCLRAHDCRVFGDEETLFSAAELLPNTLVINIARDLTVELIARPADYFALDLDAPYDANRLYDADAPLPPRAITMLGTAIKER